MSAEALSNYGEKMDTGVAKRVGETVFEKMAVDASSAVEGSEMMSPELTNSVTWLGDGQSVPDER